MVSVLSITSEGPNGSFVRILKSCLLLKMLVCPLLEICHIIDDDNEYVHCTPWTILYGGPAPPSQRDKNVPDDGGPCIIYLWTPEEPAGYHIVAA